MTKGFQQKDFEDAAEAVAALSLKIYNISGQTKRSFSFGYNMRTALPKEDLRGQIKYFLAKTNPSHHDLLKLSHIFDIELPQLLLKLKSAYMTAAGDFDTKDWENALLVFKIAPEFWDLRLRFENILSVSQTSFETYLKSELHGNTMHRLRSHAALPLTGKNKTFIVEFEPGYGNSPYTISAPSAEAAVARLCVLGPHCHESLLKVNEVFDPEDVADKTYKMLLSLKGTPN